MKKFLFLIFLIKIHSAYSKELSAYSKELYKFAYQPWHIGSLLSFDGQNTPKNVVAIQPYLFVRTNYGDYGNNFSLKSESNEVVVIPLNVLYYGFTDFWDMQLTLQTISSFKQGKSTTNFSDILLLFGFQLLKETKNLPFVRLLIQETFPTGKYDKSTPSKKETDIAGQGAFITSFGFATEKTHNWFYNHPIRTRWNFLVNVPSKISVKGINFYQGAPDTDGVVKNNASIFILFSPEISINQRWVITADITYLKQLKGSFSGNKGTNPEGNEALVNIFQSDSFELAPAVEYNFSEKFGVIGGIWFSVFGRNTEAFVTGVISAFVTF